jgi:hypothetical protein
MLIIKVSNNDNANIVIPQFYDNSFNECPQFKFGHLFTYCWQSQHKIQK